MLDAPAWDGYHALMVPQKELRPSLWKIFAFLWEFFTEKPVPPLPGMEDWVRRHFDAVRARDKEAYANLVYPASRPAIDTAGPMGNLMEKEFKAGPLEHWTFKVTEVQPREALLMEDLLVYPVRPTHLARATAKQPGRSKTEVWYMIQEAGTWYSVLPMPKPEHAAQLKVQGEAKHGDDERIEKLYYAADPGKLTKIRELLRTNRRLEAYKKAQVEFGLNEADARKIVKFMEEK